MKNSGISYGPCDMHKLAQTLIVLFMCCVTYANGQIVPALPFQLQNNTVADATQVMANFNQILNSTNANAAKNGANSDITSLLGLTTPLAPSMGGTSTWTGGTSTGAANAQVLASVTPSTFSLTTGSRVVFKAGFANTAALTLNVAASGVKNVYRQTNVGPTITAGGEIRANQMVEVIYDGTQFQLVGPPAIIGQIQYIGMSALPPGWLYADGSCVSQTTYAALFALISTNYGSCSAGNFALPDMRGRTMASGDEYGLTGAANRLTAGGSSCGATVLGAGCGVQNQTIAHSQLPNVVLNTTIGAGQGSHDHSYTVTSIPAGTLAGGGSDPRPQVAAGTTGASTLPSMTGTTPLGGSGVALTTLQPTLVVGAIVKY